MTMERLNRNCNNGDATVGHLLRLASAVLPGIVVGGVMIVAVLNYGQVRAAGVRIPGINTHRVQARRHGGIATRTETRVSSKMFRRGSFLLFVHRISDAGDGWRPT